MLEFTLLVRLNLIFSGSTLLSSGDEGFRATSRLLDAAKVIPADDGEQKSKRIPATNIAFGFEGSVFAWMSDPERSWRGERLGQAMKQLHTVLNSHVSEGQL